MSDGISWVPTPDSDEAIFVVEPEFLADVDLSALTIDIGNEVSRKTWILHDATHWSGQAVPF